MNRNPASSRIARRRAHARALAGRDASGAVSLRAAVEARAAVDEVTRERTPRWGGRLAAGTASALAGAFALTLWLSGYPNWWLAAVAFYGAGYACARGAHRHVRRPLLVAALAVVTLASAAGVLGARSTVTVNGRPVASWSLTGRVARDVAAIDDDLRAIQRADELLAVELTAARARLRDLENTRDAMRALARENVNATGATAQLTEAKSAVANAADAAATALELKLNLAVQYDTRAESEMLARRSTLVAEALRAGQLVRLAAEAAGVELGVTE
jgi:hypothetical protein